MKKILLGIALAATSTASFADPFAESSVDAGLRRNRETFERECIKGVAIGIYSLARLDWLETRLMVDTSKSVATDCRSVSNSEVIMTFALKDPLVRAQYMGADFAAAGVGLDEKTRKGFFVKAM